MGGCKCFILFNFFWRGEWELCSLQSCRFAFTGMLWALWLSAVACSINGADGTATTSTGSSLWGSTGRRYSVLVYCQRCFACGAAHARSCQVAKGAADVHVGLLL